MINVPWISVASCL